MAIEYLDPNKKFFVGQAEPTKPTPVATGLVQPVTKPTIAPVVANVPPAVTAPQLPQPVALDKYATLAESKVATLESQRKAVEDAYKMQLTEIDKKQAEAEKKQAEFTKKQEGIIEGPVKNLQDPFRQELEQGERNRLNVNENFQANQKLINELDGLLTESNAMINKLENQKVPGLAGLQQSPRMVNALNNIEARVGVINAVMASRNNQISVAENMIDRSVEAINNDRQDQLSYYQTLYDFYDGQRDEEGNKLLQLNKDEEKFLTAQIGLLEGDLARSQESADYIKKLMISPDTAKFMADAGITLNDDVSTIQKKMAFQAGVEERKAKGVTNKAEAFEAGIKSEFYFKDGELIRTSDGWTFENPAEFKEMTGMTVDEARAKGMVGELDVNVLLAKKQVAGLLEKYWDAGILPTDDIDTATRKAMKSAIYLDAIRPPGGGGSGDGDTSAAAAEGIGLYNSTINEAMMQGATPEDAVFAAIAVAGQLGSKLSNKEQTALLKYAREMQGKIAPAPADGGNSGSAANTGGAKTSVRDVARELPGAYFRAALAKDKAMKNIDKGIKDTVVGLAEGIGDFFK